MFLRVSVRRAVLSKYKPNRCSYGDESAYTSPQSYTLPSTEPAWIADPTLTYEAPDDFPVNEETETEKQEPEIDEFDLIGDLFSDPISVVVPVSDENPTETPEISILPENPTIEQLNAALEKKPPTCAGITATYVCGTHDGTPTYSGESISITAGDELAMNSLVLTIVEIDPSAGSGQAVNGMGTIKLPMLNGAKVGLKLSGIQAVKGGCIVAGRAELGGVPMLNLDAKLKENLESLAMGLQVIGLAGQEYATEIANGINKTIDSIEELGKKLTEKKRNTKALLAATNVTDLTQVLSNCTEISQDSKTLQDSLQAMICKVETGKLKANLNKLKKAQEENKAFMDKLGPALADCQNTAFVPWEATPCNGPCAFEWENYAVDENCKKKLDEVFGVGKNDISLEDIISFFEIMDGCYEGWKYQKKGIIPTCLWDNLDTVNPYAAGFIDRGWEFAKGEDINALIQDFDKMFCAWNTAARKIQKWVNYGDCTSMSEAEAARIQKQTEETIKFIAKFSSDQAFQLKVTALAAIQVSKYIEDVPNDKLKQHQLGGLIFDAATILGPIALKAGKAANLTTELTNAFKNSKVTDKFIELARGKGFRIRLQGAGDVGIYTTKIKWGILDVDARPFGNKGFWGKRIAQNDTRIDAFELKVNPNNESFYVEHPNGGFVQFENLNANALQDGKLVLQPNNSFYRVYDKPEFLRQKVLDEAIRQTQAANAKGLTVEWLVSDQTAVNQLTQFFSEKNVNVVVKYLAE